MNKRLMRGIGAGVIASVAITALSMQMKKPSRRMRRGAKKAYRIMSSVMDDVGQMMH